MECPCGTTPMWAPTPPATATISNHRPVFHSGQEQRVTSDGPRSEAWHDALTDKYRDEVLRTLVRNLGGYPEEARDLTAHTFETAWRRRDRVPDDPRAWLMRTARNFLRNHLRATNRRPLDLVG